LSLLQSTTPVILTFNEAPNIARTLAALAWAADIVVVDSGSTDGTLEILARHANVRVFHRQFETHAEQWRFALDETAIASDWIFRLDADYLMTPELTAEIAALSADAPCDAYEIAFDYAVCGHRLRGSLYPAKPLLFRRGGVAVVDKGHTEGWTVMGPLRKLRGVMIHDDRKPMRHFVEAQARYMARELPYLQTNRRGLKNRLRLLPPIMPIAVFVYCLLGKGLILNGAAGLLYSLQRLLAETALSLMLLEERLRQKKPGGEG
jgi:glycosyltransferase involved in cell wall biosynthesis